MKPVITRTLAVSTVALALAAQSGVAQADTTVLTDQVLAPFHLEVVDGNVMVADGFLGGVFRIGGDGALRAIARESQPADVSGLSAGPGGALAWTTTDFATGRAVLKVKTGSTVKPTALSKFEAKFNPDSFVHYGVKGKATKCQRQTIKALGGEPKYTGIVDSHPYDVTYAAGGWVVADAGGNDLVKVDSAGVASTLTVLPTRPFTFTDDIVAGLGLPDCMKGVTYKFEAVPTGVELGPDGWLYVSSLPGGPEDPSFGARGSVFKVNPATGDTQLVATGFAGATDVAVGANGSVYVAELFGGQITRIAPNGSTNVVTSLPGALSVEYADGHLYAGTFAPTDDQGNPTGPGTVVKVW